MDCKSPACQWKKIASAWFVRVEECAGCKMLRVVFHGGGMPSRVYHYERVER